MSVYFVPLCSTKIGFWRNPRGEKGHIVDESRLIYIYTSYF